jgi:Rrf2 family protein
MVLGSHVEWALHCCSVLAMQPEGETISTRDLAEFHGVPKEYLSKALQALATAGILEGSLGPRGGYRLARDPSRVSFLEIVEALEGRKSTFQCTGIVDRNPCLSGQPKSKGVCAVARVMSHADEAWRESLRKVSLAGFRADLEKELGKGVLDRNAGWFADRK